MIKNLLFKNIDYSNVRFIYTRNEYPSGTPVDINYSDAAGDRYYYSVLGSSESNTEAATFKSFISVTMSGSASHSIEIVPIAPGELVHLTTTITAVNASVSKGLIADTNVAYINTGTEIKPIGGTPSIEYNIKKDFMTASVAYVTNATQSISLVINGELGEVLDWNIYFCYKKGFHNISGTVSNPTVIYPDYPSS
jgi:hypothetical protein